MFVVGVKGVQIDLLTDRADGVVNPCEGAAGKMI